MGKGARKGEARLLGFKHVPDAIQARLAEQAATVASKKRTRARASQHSETTTEDEQRRSGVTTVDFDIEPKGREHPHVKLAERYVSDVAKGKIDVCEHVRNACARFTAMRADKRFVFRGVDAERVCLALECFPHVKGRWSSDNLTLEPWQCFIVCAIFGFFWADSPMLRVIKTVYIEVPRKNAKSTLAAGIGLYMLTEDGEPGPEVYSAATTHKQALAIFDTARAMARRQMAFQEKHDIVVQRNDISVWGTLGKFQALHSQGETLDGLNGYCILIDELHAHKTRSVYDVLETSMGSRENPLLFNITTAGFNRSGVCYDTRAYLIKLLTNQHDDPTFFGVIYTIDKGDDPHDPKTWAKANPNYGVSVKPEQLARLSAKAQVSNAALATFLTKHLDVWVNAAVGWMDMLTWDACGDAPPIEAFLGGTAKAGLDLASKVDIASKALVFKRELDGEDHYYVYLRHYAPESRASPGTGISPRNAQGEDEDDETDDNANAYWAWAQQGHLVLTPGNVIDMDQIENDAKQDARDYSVSEFAYDPHQATQLSSHLSADGITTVEILQNVKNFSETMKEVERLCLTGRLHHTGDPVLAWMVSNVAVKVDFRDNIFPRRESPQSKIDGAVAMFMAFNRWIVGEPVDEESHGLVVL